MRRLWGTIGVLAVSCAPAWAQPRIGSILNSASYIVSPLPGSGIAQGSIFVIFGTGLGPGSLVQQTVFPLPVDLAGSSIRISSGGTEVNAFMIYSSAGQVSAILPSNTPPGRATVRVVYNGISSDLFPFDVVRNAPGIYTLSSSGSGPAVVTTTRGEPITYTFAALEGEALSAWGTGLTALQGRPDNEAAEVFDPSLTVEVIVGGRRANVRYRGRAPTLAGLDQIVFDVPAGVRGCAVSLVLRVSSGGPGVLSNYGTLAIGGDSRTCSDANGFRDTDLENAASRGLRIGTIRLTRSRTKVLSQGLPADERTDSGAATFTRLDPDSLVRSRGLGNVSPSSCVVYPFQGSEAAGDRYLTALLNAGSAVNVTNGAGVARSMGRVAGGGYGATFGTAVTAIGVPVPPSQLFLDPGSYTLSGPGGADLGAFTTRITVPAPMTTNIDTFTSVQRSAGLRVTWSGAEAANEIVAISGTSLRTGPDAGASFVCAERGSAGQFVVPPEVLLSLPQSAVRQETPLGTIRVSSSPLSDRFRFSAIGLDLGMLLYQNEELRTVPYQ